MEFLTLHSIDYRNLMNLSERGHTCWEHGSLARCVQAGLVIPNGRKLTTIGERKTRFMAHGVEELRAGMPLDKRTANRASEIFEEPWYAGKLGRKPLAFNSHCLFAGNLVYFDATIQKDDEQWKRIRPQIKRIINSHKASWLKLTPYAVQIDSLGGLEGICMSWKGKRFFRIQSGYYDYLSDRYKTLTWACNEQPTRNSFIVARIHRSGLVLPGNIAAIINTVELPQPFPAFTEP